MDDKLVSIYRIHKNDNVTIETSRDKRDWMENTPHKFAYRCLPLSIANQHGWCFYLKNPISFMWDGKPALDCIKFYENPDGVASSSFGNGIVTFHINFLVRVPEGYSIYISGAPNHFITDIQALTGVYEADWAPYSFTMNWKVTNAFSTITFTENDPICFFFPVKRDSIEQFKIEVKDIEDNPELHKQYNQFNFSRNEFIENLRYVTNPSEGWQKHYFQGKYPDGSKCPFDHKTKLKLDEPK